MTSTLMLPSSFPFSQPAKLNWQNALFLLIWWKAEFIWKKGSDWAFIAACGLPIEDRCPMVWMLLIGCHFSHSVGFPLSHFLSFLVSESSSRKARRFLPEDEISCSYKSSRQRVGHMDRVLMSCAFLSVWINHSPQQICNFSDNFTRTRQ